MGDSVVFLPTVFGVSLVYMSTFLPFFSLSSFIIEAFLMTFARLQSDCAVRQCVFEMLLDSGPQTRNKEEEDAQFEMRQQI